MRAYGRFVFVAVVALALLCTLVVNAQYRVTETSPVTVPESGVVTVDQVATTGVSIEIAGAPGTTGSVTAAVYTENPQPNANIPAGVSLTRFVVITLDIPAENFISANVTIHYTDDDVAGLTPPIVLYKYIPETNSFVELPTVDDPVAKTLTVTLTSTTDPLFAVGGRVVVSPSPTFTPTPTLSPSPTQEPTPSDSSWIIVVALVVAVLLMVIFMLVRRKIIKL